MSHHNSVPYPHDHVQPILDRGFTLRAISRGIGLHPGSLDLCATVGTCAPTTRRALLALDINQCHPQPAWRATRRIRALMAAGVTLDTIAAGTGLHASYISQLAAERKIRIDRENFLRIDQAWRARKDQPVRPANGHVARRGWAVPWAWDDIDGPDDLHRDMRVPIRPVLDALERAITKWGRARVAEILDVDPRKISDLRRQTSIRRSRKDDILRRLDRESRRLAGDRYRAPRNVGAAA